MADPHTSLRRTALAGLAACAALGVAAAAPAAPQGDELPHSIGEVAWDAGAVEHLFNRAAFGVAASEIPALVERAPEEVVAELVDGGRPVEPFLATRRPVGFHRDIATLPAQEQQELKRSLRALDRQQLQAYGGWWIQQMLDEVDPLRDRMTLFWHGFFTTNARELRRNYEVVLQQIFLRENALESYADMLARIVRDPAMLYYLDNTSNKAGSPNENLARELMELFSLGVGNYTEEDVREVARALTGFTADREGEFTFDRKTHDGGVKTILGEEGEFDGDDVARILLQQDACARWVARRILEHFEGLAPAEARLERYAEILRSSDYRVRPLLRELFLDPEFYRAEVRGARVLGPVEFVVSSSKRLGVRPSSRFVYEAASSLGQRLFEPPNVKGWEEGVAWITTASLLQRGNVAGMLLGVTDLENAVDSMPMMDSMDMRSEDEMRPARGRAGARRAPARGGEESMEPRMDPREADSDEPGLPKMLRNLDRYSGSNFGPTINLTWRMQQAGARTDAQIVDLMLDALLAIEPPADVRPPLIRFVRSQREAFQVDEGSLFEVPEVGEDVLRRLAHLILSLPEAQLG